MREKSQNTVSRATIISLLRNHPRLQNVIAGEELLWVNPAYSASRGQSFSAADSDQQPECTGPENPHQGELDPGGVYEAEARLKRFAPLITYLFPETGPEGGIIESPLREAPHLEAWLGQPSRSTGDVSGRVLLKCDNQLPVSGSIKARGGIYEVLKHAEELVAGEISDYRSLADTEVRERASDYSRLSGAEYRRFATPEYRAFFSTHTLSVGSTGNLGLSIGIMGRALGFRVIVHMSSDAQAWKKQLLREQGAEVIEHQGDYAQAVEEGRRACLNDPACYFIDDEHSKELFYGYSVAALRLAGQLEEQSVTVDTDHPLFVYLPCGVGGGPGGITYGLKLLYGDNVHCFFAEPTAAPGMLVGLLTGLHDALSFEDLCAVGEASGVEGGTIADGLAVTRPSGLVGRNMAGMISGVYTVDDSRLLASVAALANSEDIFVEPSAAAGIPGPLFLLGTEEGRRYLEQHVYAAEGSPPEGEADRSFAGQVSRPERATHLIWLTGGSMVPEAIMQEYVRQGQQFLADEH